jgi:RNA-directed DNA polymerase
MTATGGQGNRVRAPGAGAAPGVTADDWIQVDWKKVYANVRRLQARIAKATQEGRWGKVRTLQRLLTHSYSGKALVRMSSE